MIKRGGQARYIGESFEDFPTGSIFFVREVRDDSATVQDPWDSHIRCSIPLSDLEEVK